MTLPEPDGATGLLPEGSHGATWAEVRAVLVDGAPPSQRGYREMVLSVLVAWSSVAEEHLGPGVFLVAGGFVTFNEPTWRATAAYVPDDDQRFADAVGAHGPYWQLVPLDDVMFTEPGPGGGHLARRTSVGGVLDAVVIKDADRQLMHRVLSVSDSPNPIGRVRKGYVEVVIGP